ncbi:MAG: aromatic amino acid hydroxylase, partial [Polaribacter sp.]
IQISGVFTNVISDENSNPIYFQTLGKTALANRDRELIGHGVENHKEGFGSPVGKLKGINIPIENMSPRDLEAYQIYEEKKIVLEFEGGIKVEGEVITGTRDLRGKILLISFQNCTVIYKKKMLFKPEWGIYHMAVGKEIVSAYAGSADINSFANTNKVSATKTHKIKYSEKERVLYALYADVRKMRQEKSVTEEKITATFHQLKNNFPLDWLLSLELYEVALQNNFPIQIEIMHYLLKLQKKDVYKKLITNGLNLLNVNELQS